MFPKGSSIFDRSSRYAGLPMDHHRSVRSFDHSECSCINISQGKTTGRRSLIHDSVVFLVDRWLWYYGVDRCCMARGQYMTMMTSDIPVILDVVLVFEVAQTFSIWDIPTVPSGFLMHFQLCTSGTSMYSPGPNQSYFLIIANDLKMGQIGIFGLIREW